MEKFGSVSSTEYLQQANESLVTIVQIETKEALEDVRVFKIKHLEFVDCGIDRKLA